MTVLQRLLRGLQLDMAIKITWATLIITFIPCIIMCLVECHPIQKYWQLFPNPGTYSHFIIFHILGGRDSLSRTYLGNAGFQTNAPQDPAPEVISNSSSLPSLT